MRNNSDYVSNDYLDLFTPILMRCITTLGQVLRGQSRLFQGAFKKTRAILSKKYYNKRKNLRIEKNNPLKLDQTMSFKTPEKNRLAVESLWLRDIIIITCCTIQLKPGKHQTCQMQTRYVCDTRVRQWEIFLFQSSLSIETRYSFVISCLSG